MRLINSFSLGCATLLICETTKARSNAFGPDTWIDSPFKLAPKPRAPEKISPNTGTLTAAATGLACLTNAIAGPKIGKPCTKLSVASNGSMSQHSSIACESSALDASSSSLTITSFGNASLKPEAAGNIFAFNRTQLSAVCALVQVVTKKEPLLVAKRLLLVANHDR